MDKTERMEVDEEDPVIEMNKVSTTGTMIASERETVKPENIKDNSVAKFFTCTICDKLSREPLKLDTSNHSFCKTCVYEGKKVSKK